MPVAPQLLNQHEGNLVDDSSGRTNAAGEKLLVGPKLLRHSLSSPLILNNNVVAPNAEAEAS